MEVPFKAAICKTYSPKFPNTKKMKKKHTTKNKVQFGCSAFVPVRVYQIDVLEKVSHGVTDLNESSPARI